MEIKSSGQEDVMEIELPTSSTDPSGCGKVKSLDQITASTLRKSQIINKVSDIVRELVENAIDADAATVQISLLKFGLAKIEVRDNGHGILPEDVPFIFAGGHTSKLKDTNNLTRGKYFGFRGEALNAMCAIAKVSLVTKTVRENAGRKYQFDFLGKVVSEGKVPHSGGTTITVEKLFEGIPVRRQRLENTTAASNELKDIEAFLKGVALANPKCHLSFYHDTSLLWTKPSVQTMEQALIAVLGHSMAKKMGKFGPIKVNVDEENDGSNCRSIELHLPKKPVDMRTMSYTSNKMAMIFCNRKRVYIRDFEKLLHQYITAVVEKPQPADQRRFPVSVLSIKVPPEEVDFNRDTDKTKVFLVNKDKIHEVIEEALMSFYSINLNGSDKSNDVPDQAKNNIADPGIHPSTYDRSNSGSVGVTGKEVQARSSEVVQGNGNNKVVPIVSSDVTRQGIIASFLQEIPANTSAFSNSPSKAGNVNAEGVSMSFPVSKPIVETSVLNQTPDRNVDLGKTFVKPPVAVTSNFDLSFESLLFTQTPLEPTSSSATEKTSETSFKKTNGDNKSKGFLEANVENWFNGRILDKVGGKVESVIAVNKTDSKNEKNEDYEKFRSIVAGPSKSFFNGNGSFRRSAPCTPYLSSVSEPSQKRGKFDTSPFSAFPTSAIKPSRPSSFSVPTTPAILHKQVTLDSLSKWPTPSSSIFSQRASETVAGIRIPLAAPRKSADIERPRQFQNSLTKSIELFEQQERHNLMKKPVSASASPQSLDWAPVSQFIAEELPNLQWAPRISGKIETNCGVGPLYFAQTQTTLGVFSPANMLKYFPEEYAPNRSRNSTLSSSEEGWSEDEVTYLFLKFISQPGLWESQFSSKIFHVIRELPALRSGYQSMNNKRIFLSSK